MKTQDQDKAIALFMGGKTNKTALPGIAERMNNNEIWLPFHGICRYDELRYHKSWDWLMPVIEKIKQTENVITVTIEITFDAGSVTIINAEEYYKQTYEPVTIKSVYKAVVDFIRWYNQQKP